jgi:hypothetical protein
MPFPTSTGILLPADFNIIHRIYTDIASEAWFTTSDERREQFAITVIDVYRQGVQDPAVLAERCRNLAREHYGNASM